MFTNTRFAAVAIALVVSGFAGAAHASDAFGGGDHEMVITQAAQSPVATGMTKADDRFTVGSNAWTGDRDALVTAGASTGFAKRVLATNAR
jgi:hypothetical protein